MSWLENSKKNLLPLSRSKEFSEALKEWRYAGCYIDLEEDRADCELCEHPDIKYQFEIRNSHTHFRLLVGSECIRKFSISAVDEFGQELGRNESLQKLGRDRRKAVAGAEERKIVNTLVILANADEDFDIESFIEYFRTRSAFTPRQLATLIWRLKKLRINFEGCKFKVVLRREREKAQIKEMERWQLKNIWPYLTESQRQVCRQLRAS